MACVFPKESVSFPCILEIIQEVRSGKQPTINLGRKIGKVIDNGLSMLAGDDAGDSITLLQLSEEISVTEEDLEALNTSDDQIEHLCSKLEGIVNSADASSAEATVDREQVKQIIYWMTELLNMIANYL